jgi:hypothetical protein
MGVIIKDILKQEEGEDTQKDGRISLEREVILLKEDINSKLVSISRSLAEMTSTVSTLEKRFSALEQTLEQRLLALEVKTLRLENKISTQQNQSQWLAPACGFAVGSALVFFAMKKGLTISTTSSKI